MDKEMELQSARQELTRVLKAVEKKATSNLSVSIDDRDKEFSGATVAGLLYSNVSNASTMYGQDKFNTPRGHGFAAEQANHLYDKVTNMDFFGQGKVQLVGDTIDPNTGHIVKSGADRIVNGVQIQTKYCASGSKCISECFENGKLKYLNADNSPMQIEVPSDKYESAIQAMESRIRNGEVPGISDPAEAKNIVKKGKFTYLQAKNIAKAGTVESLAFDSVNGTIIATGAFGISATLSFATSIWNGEEPQVALKSATHEGLRVAGTTFMTAVLASQLSRAGLNSALVGSSEAVVKVLGPKASHFMVQALNKGTNIYGAAAMKSAAKLLRSNAITSGVSIVVLSSVDVVNIFRGRISGKQLAKNVANTTASVAAGTAGWMGGATAGAALGSVVPVIGTAVGGFVGGLIGSFAAGSVASKATTAVLDNFIEDDADEMLRIIQDEFAVLAEEYLLNQGEAEAISDELAKVLTPGELKDMFASSDRKRYANCLLSKPIEAEVSRRQKIKMPSEEEMQRSLREVLEELADMEEAQEKSKEDLKAEKVLLFKMNVEDIFSITGRGIVVTGIVEEGELEVGDNVILSRKERPEIEATVVGIEMFRKLLDRALTGDSVGILLKGIKREDVQCGDVLVKVKE